MIYLIYALIFNIIAYYLAELRVRYLKSKLKRWKIATERIQKKPVHQVRTILSDTSWIKAKPEQEQGDE